MNHISPKRLWIAAAIIALIVIGGFVLSVPHTRDVPAPTIQTVAPSVPPVTMRDSYKKGTHTITGSLLAPDACIAASAQAVLQGQSILIQISMPSDTGVCLQIPTRVNFSTTIAAPAQLPLTVTVNGSLATTTTP